MGDWAFRRAAIGDLDNDGRLDAVMIAQNDPLVFFHNREIAGLGHSITFRLEGTRSNRDAVGTVVFVHAGGRARIAVRLGGGSFQSAGDPRLHFGLGPCDRVKRVEVRWPSGRVDQHRDLTADGGYVLCEEQAEVRPMRGFDRRPNSPGRAR